MAVSKDSRAGAPDPSSCSRGAPAGLAGSSMSFSSSSSSPPPSGLIAGLARGLCRFGVCSMPCATAPCGPGPLEVPADAAACACATSLDRDGLLLRGMWLCNGGPPRCGGSGAGATTGGGNAMVRPTGDGGGTRSNSDAVGVAGSGMDAGGSGTAGGEGDRTEAETPIVESSESVCDMGDETESARGSAVGLGPVDSASSPSACPLPALCVEGDNGDDMVGIDTACEKRDGSGGGLERCCSSGVVRRST